MKPFNELSQQEINELPQEKFLAIDPEIRRSCFDCGWIVGYVNLWCKSEDAIECRGTAIPGCIKCTYWKPIEENNKNQWWQFWKKYDKPSWLIENF